MVTCRNASKVFLVFLSLQILDLWCRLPIFIVKLIPCSFFFISTFSFPTECFTSSICCSSQFSQVFPQHMHAYAHTDACVTVTDVQECKLKHSKNAIMHVIFYLMSCWQCFIKAQKHTCTPIKLWTQKNLDIIYDYMKIASLQGYINSLYHKPSAVSCCESSADTTKTHKHHLVNDINCLWTKVLPGHNRSYSKETCLTKSNL